MEKLNCEQAKRLHLFEYLVFLGHQPQRIRNEGVPHNSTKFLQKKENDPPGLRNVQGFRRIV